MTYSGHTTRTISTVNQSSREGAKITNIVLHHMASTGLEGVLSMWSNATRVGSANYAIGNEGQIIGVVPEELRAWSLGSAYDGGRGAAFDRKSITFEIENESTNGWTVSAKAHEATAQVVADLSKRYGIALNRTQILGHREVYTRYGASYATACPGGLDMDWIVNRAAQILKGGGGSIPPIASTGTANGAPALELGGNRTSHPTADIQRIVGATPDGIYGPDTTAKVKAWQKAHGLDPDGIVGPQTAGVMFPPTSTKAPAFPLPAGSYFGPKSGPAESVSGYYSHRDDLKTFQRQMQARGWDFSEYGIDGLYGDELRGNVVEFQREKGLKVDGLIGPQTWAAAWTSPVT